MRAGFVYWLLGVSLTAGASPNSAGRIAAPALPLCFEARGSEFVALGIGYTARILPHGVVIGAGTRRVRMSLINADTRASLAGAQPLLTSAVSFVGSVTPRRSTLFHDVRSQSVYPGINVVFHGRGDRLEYDFEVAPNADAGRIGLRFDGNSTRVGDRGELIVSGGTGEISLEKPQAWQMIDGRRKAVGVRYEIGKRGDIRFRTDGYDRRHGLTIDPVLLVDTYFGGSGNSVSDAIAIDAAGNIYVAGDTDSTDFPASYTLSDAAGVLPPPRNIFVTKWSPAGDQLLYAARIGGTGYDQATGVAVDGGGNVFVDGTTSSRDFPVTAGAFQKGLAGTRDPFLFKLSSDGSKLGYSTYLGGDGDATGGLAVDAADNAYAVGNTSIYVVTSNSPCKPPLGLGDNYPMSGDAFVRKLSADGSSLIFDKRLGGSCGETGVGIGIDPAGSVWATGATYSQDFPVTTDALQSSFGGGFGDGFLVRLGAGGETEYSTYLGGPGYDVVNGIAFDASGNAWLTGGSAGFSQPASPGAYQPNWNNGSCFILNIGPPLFNPNPNAFVMKLSNDKRVTGLTYLGSLCRIQASGIAVDGQGYPWITGAGASGQLHGYSMPTVSPLRIEGGGGFISRFSPDLTKLVFSTWFDNVSGLALDSGGKAWVAGYGVPDSGPTKAVLARLDPTPPAISIDTVTSFYPEPLVTVTDLSPGKLVRLQGSGLGPVVASAGVITPAGFVGTSASGVQVMFGGVPAPLLSVSSGEIQCAVPFGVAPGQAMVQVLYNGLTSNSVRVEIRPTALEVLGTFNADFTPNSGSNPAAPGSVVIMYVTGAGQTNPPSVDGKISSAPLGQVPAIAVRSILMSDSAPVPVLFAAAADGAIAGVIQINFQVRAVVGTQVIGVSVGGNETFANVVVK